MSVSSFDVAFERVQELAATFKANENRYLASDYQEAEVRKDFIDKFFMALGWDVNHDVQTNPYEQEVKVEPSVAASGQRRADYAFFLVPNFRDVRFFVEAKKPYGDIATKENYFQVIRYGWNSETPLAVLTDFEQFHVIDCRYKPDVDTALNRAVAKFHYSDYANAEKFKEIYWLFSREAVAAGSLEKRAQEMPKPRGKAVQRGLFAGGWQSIDESFLAELDEHRTDLAKAFKKYNPKLDSEQLTEATQRTLDRLVFIRFLEDKGIEAQRLVDKFGDKGTAWEDFIATSRRLDGIYNGIVFKDHPLLDKPGFRVDDDLFADICEKLAHVNSPYDFNAIPIHILGSIYERFLGKVIVATDKRVRVEEKPEVRKAGGVYYTPEYIVRYIVENTVGKLIAGKTPDQIAEMRFADIACGSGSFLLGVYDLLLTYHGNYYNQNPGKAKKGDCLERDGKLYLSLRKKREILLNNIYGVDIDAQAVEVCQLSLYLKLLQDETTASAHQYLLDFEQQALLPSLNQNIVCGNSLIGTDILDGQLFASDEERKLNPMNFEDAFPEVMKRGGFDAIVGNPPFVDSEEMVKTSPILRSYALSRYEAAKGNWDLFCLFLERMAKLTKKGGRSALIVPNKLLSADYARATRDLLVSRLDTIRDYSSVDVFHGVSVYPVIVITENGRNAKSPVKFATMAKKADQVVQISERLVEPATLKSGSGSWAIHFGLGASLLQKLSGIPTKLADVAKVTGAATVSEAYDLKTLMDDVRKPSSKFIRFINTGTVDRFESLWGRFKTAYIKNSYSYPVVESSKLARRFPHRYEQAKTPKIITAGMTKELECFCDEAGAYLAGKSTTIVIPVTLNLLYLVGLLNSRLLTYFYKETFRSLSLAGGFFRVGPPQLGQLPIVVPEPSNTKAKALHDAVVAKVEAMLEAKKALAKAKTERERTYYEQKCAALDRQIDRLVYDLYGLTEAEIKVVEGISERE